MVSPEGYSRASQSMTIHGPFSNLGLDWFFRLGGTWLYGMRYEWLYHCLALTEQWLVRSFTGLLTTRERETMWHDVRLFCDDDDARERDFIISGWQLGQNPLRLLPHSKFNDDKGKEQRHFCSLLGEGAAWFIVYLAYSGYRSRHFYSRNCISD